MPPRLLGRGSGSTQGLHGSSQEIGPESGEFGPEENADGESLEAAGQAGEDFPPPYALVVGGQACSFPMVGETAV